jgi:hypothetical protein
MWWIAPGILALVGTLGIVSAVVMAQSIPREGDSRIETLVAAFTAAGATFISVAGALFAVLFPLQMEWRRAQRIGEAKARAEQLNRAVAWIWQADAGMSMLSADLKETADDPDSGARANQLDLLRSRAERFYRDDQRLDEVQDIARLLDSEDAVRYLRDAERALRAWNEKTVSRDDPVQGVTVGTEHVELAASTAHQLKSAVRGLEALHQQAADALKNLVD